MKIRYKADKATSMAYMVKLAVFGQVGEKCMKKLGEVAFFGQINGKCTMKKEK